MGGVGGVEVRMEVDSQAEKDAAEHPRQTGREEKVLEKNSMIPWSHAGSCLS